MKRNYIYRIGAKGTREKHYAYTKEEAIATKRVWQDCGHTGVYIKRTRY